MGPVAVTMVLLLHLAQFMPHSRTPSELEALSPHQLGLDQVPTPAPSTSAPSSASFTQRRRHGETVWLVCDTEIPSHVRRSHILAGYRPLLQSDESLTRNAFYGLLSIHNETLNVWSHLCGALWALLQLRWAANLPDNAMAADASARTSVCIFLVTAAFCFAVSSAAHLVAPIVSSRVLSMGLWRLDSFGICLLVGGSYLPGMHFAFRCQPGWRFTYNSVALLVLVVAGCTSAMAEGRPGIIERVRVGSLVLSVAFGVVPLTHFCLVAPRDEVVAFLPPVARMFLFYGVGFFFYGSAFPESLQPGKVRNCMPRTRQHRTGTARARARAFAHSVPLARIPSLSHCAACCRLHAPLASLARLLLLSLVRSGICAVAATFCGI